MSVDAPLAFVGGALVDLEAGDVDPNTVVVVESGRITQVGPAAEFSAPPGMQVVDVSGAWLLPGLVDMHVHLPFDGVRSALRPLYLAHGVTTVRDVGNNITELSLLRAKIELGEELEPRLFFAGNLLDGLPPLWPDHTLLVDTVPRARTAVRMLIAQGVDCLKVYNNVPRDSLVAIVEEAHRENRYVLGHIPRTVKTSDAVEIGMDCLEHIRITGRELLPLEEADSIDHLPLGTRETLLWDRFELESQGMTNLISLLVERGTFLDPTMIVDADMFAGGVHDVEAEKLEESLPEPVRKALRSDSFATLRGSDDLAEKALRGFEKRLEFIRMCHRAGVRLLAGTDTFGSGGMLPGAGLHYELALLHRAGLSPLDALRAATITAAQCLRRAEDLGSIKTGKLADILVLDANPLAEVSNARKIRTVISRGRVHYPADLIAAAVQRAGG